MISPESVTQTLSFFTLLADLVIVGFVILFAFAYFTKNTRAIFKNPLIQFVSKNARVIAFTIAMSGIIGSLFYSEIAGYAPCKMCWYQRIFLYPMPLLLGLSIIKNDKKIADYILAMTLTGGILAGYHYYLQRGGVSFVSCSTVGYSVDCADSFTMSFGYITIPVMAFTAFIAIGIVMWLYKVYNKSK